MSKLSLPFALLIIASAVHAQDAKSEDAWTHMAAKYDADGDGRITRKEYTRDEAHWKNLDVDGNGVVDRAEFEGRGWTRGARGGKPPAAPKKGQEAPDFKLELLPPPALKALDKDQQEAKKPELVQLSSFRGKRPVALIFGSYT